MFRRSIAAIPFLAVAGAASATPIQHVIIIMQENRSFDHYFGTFPGANGTPAGTCVPLDPNNPQGGCVAPFHDSADVDAGGPHAAIPARLDLDNGVTTAKMDGFVATQNKSAPTKVCQRHPNDPQCAGSALGKQMHDVMGYKTAAELPNYWAYAQNFVLQDSLFESARGWSVPSHLYLASEWSAICSDPQQASTCASTANLLALAQGETLPWVSLFQLLDVNNVSWKYYLNLGPEPDCENGEMTCEPPNLGSKVPSLWNPAPFFAYIQQQRPTYLAAHVPNIEQFQTDLQTGRLPQVSWIVPSQSVGEHPPASISEGMDYVTSLVNSVMQSPYWNSTAIFISWDDWGGFYDHVVPPIADRNNTVLQVQGYGLRVPGIMISAWARSGMIDHQVLSHDAYATLIEDLFAHGARLNPAALGNPDNRPTIRDALTSVTLLNGQTEPVGNLMNEFDFTQTPLPPMLLPNTIPYGINVSCQISNNLVCTVPNVTISWNPVAPQMGNPTFTYNVQRDGAALPQCSGTATTCIDTPGSGTHYYSVQSIGPNGIQSPFSPTAVAQEP